MVFAISFIKKAHTHAAHCGCVRFFAGELKLCAQYLLNSDAAWEMRLMQFIIILLLKRQLWSQLYYMKDGTAGIRLQLDDLLSASSCSFQSYFADSIHIVALISSSAKSFRLTNILSLQSWYLLWGNSYNKTQWNHSSDLIVNSHSKPFKHAPWTNTTVIHQVNQMSSFYSPLANFMIS